jgi:hypothetical protein
MAITNDIVFVTEAGLGSSVSFKPSEFISAQITYIVLVSGADSSPFVTITTTSSPTAPVPQTGNSYQPALVLGYPWVSNIPVVAVVSMTVAQATTALEAVYTAVDAYYTEINA